MRELARAATGAILLPILAGTAASFLPGVSRLLFSEAGSTLLYPFAWLVALVWAGGDAPRATRYLQAEAGQLSYLLGALVMFALCGAALGALTASHARLR